MKIVVQLAVVAAAIAAGLWLWTSVFSSPQHVIRARLKEMARDASFSDSQSIQDGYAAAQTVGDFFSTNVEITLNVPGSPGRTLNGREQIVRTLINLQESVNRLKVDFPDLNVTVAPDRDSATADLTLRAQVDGVRDSVAEEMKVTLKKIGGQWLITHIETVPVLT
ncbi:MAG TPA: hypothetical protein VGN23_04135 [Verrucomicrobiae bacterium]|jgi:hypothetical protein